MRGTGLTMVLGATLAALVGSCLPPAVFDCADDEHCADLGADARCEDVGFCSQIDDGCESGRRYHEYAGNDLGGRCTEAACGDGVVHEGELCDDGNDVDGDGCNVDCQPSGQERWKVGYASPGGLRDRCYSVAVDEQGNAAVIGHVSEEGTGYNLWVRQYDAAGEIGWTWVLNGDGNADEEGWTVVALPGGDWLVGGSVATADRETDAWVGRLNADGILVWEATYDGGEAYLDTTRDVALAPNGDVVTIGYATNVRDLETDLWFQRRSPDGQTIVWTQFREGLVSNAQDRGHGLTPITGGFIGVGKRAVEESALYWVERFDEAGNTVWADEASIGDRESVWTGTAVTPEGDVMLVGWQASDAGDTDMWLQRRGPDGVVQWDETVASPGGDDDKANAIVVDARGGFIVAGEMGAGSGSTDAWIRRYAPDRSEVWTTSYSGPAGGRDTAWGLALAPDGTVWACGYEASPGTEWDLWVRTFSP